VADEPVDPPVEEKPPRLKATDREALPVIQERLRAETVLRSQGKRLRRQV
jgi:hypothetical protein